MTRQEILTLIGITAGGIISIGVAIAGYVLHGLVKQIDKLETKIESHDVEDDNRFAGLQAQINHREEAATTMRHNFRNEIMGFVGQSMKELKVDLIERFIDRGR